MQLMDLGHLELLEPLLRHLPEHIEVAPHLKHIDHSEVLQLPRVVLQPQVMQQAVYVRKAWPDYRCCRAELAAPLPSREEYNDD